MREEYISKKQLTHTKLNKNGEKSYMAQYNILAFVSRSTNKNYGSNSTLVLLPLFFSLMFLIYKQMYLSKSLFV